MRMLIISLIGQILLNYLLLLAVWKATEKGSIWRKIALGWVGVEVIYFIYVVVTTLFLNENGEFLRVGGLLFANYYVFIGILLMFLAIAYLTINALKWVGLLKEEKARRKAKGVALLVLMPSTLLLCIQGYYNTMHPVVTRYDVHLPYQGPPKKLKILLVTDLHIGEIIGKEQLRKLSEMAQAEQPDYVMVGGDQIDYYFRYVEEDPEITNLMQSLHPNPSRIFHVVGNHEHYIDLEKKCSWLATTGVLLRDSIVQLEEHLYLIGRDDAHNEERMPLAQLTAQVPLGATTILLDHQPKEPEEERANKIGLALHGHTHDGQFIPFKWLIKLNFENPCGYLLKGGTHYITSSGYGLSSSPLRVGTKSEIVVINLSLEP